MADTWLGDATSLVEAYRAGDTSPTEQVEATLAAIEASDLNAVSFVDADRARAAAADADVSLPLGGVPLLIKELDKVEGWPDTEASLVFKDRTASYTSTVVERALAAGAVPVGLATASEFGGLNTSTTRLNGTTDNPWGEHRTAGGSSGGSAAAVAGGLAPLATGGDGGGSIRIPSGFCGLPGLKGTYGRIPRGPKAGIYPLTAVPGCLARSVRDVARFFDVTNGHHPRDPFSLPRVEGWEAGLGTVDVGGLRVAVVPDLGTAIVRPEAAALVEDAADWLTSELGWKRCDVDVSFPKLDLAWALSNVAGDLLVEIGEHWPDCKDDLTPAIAFIVEFAHGAYTIESAAIVERQRKAANELMADLFEQVDVIIGLTNPDAAYPAQVQVNTMVGDQRVGVENNGALTIPSNIHGNPAMSIPVGLVDGLPIGMQVIGPHHSEPLLLEIAHRVEQGRPWPLVAPGYPS